MSTMAANAAARTRFYLMQTYFLKHGTQLARVHDYFNTSLIPWMSKAHPGPMLALEALVATHTPQAVFLSGHGSLEEVLALKDAMAAKGFAEWGSRAGSALRALHRRAASGHRLFT